MHKSKFKLKPKSSHYIEISNAHASLPAFLARPDSPNKPAIALPVPSKHSSHYQLKVARRRQSKKAKQLKNLSEDKFF